MDIESKRDRPKPLNLQHSKSILGSSEIELPIAQIRTKMPEMTFAEILLFVLIGYGFYRLLRPMQGRMEATLLRWLGGNKRRSHKPVIDVTDSSRRREGDKSGYRN